MYDRIITHNDMDGVVSAAICSYVFPITDIRFAGPNGIIRGQVSTTEHDIVCDLPYPTLCGMWFDHHEGNLQDLLYRNISIEDIKGRFAAKDSCSTVVYEYFVAEGWSLPAHFEQTVAETDIIDSFRYHSLEEWRKETPGKLTDYSIKATTSTPREQHHYMRQLVTWVRDHPLDTVVNIPEVGERVKRYKGEEEKALRLITEDSFFLPYDRHRELVVVDLTKHSRRPTIMKNLAHLLYPKAKAVLEIHNVFDRGVKTTNLRVAMSLGIRAQQADKEKDLGEIMRTLNIGDGHRGAASGVVYTRSKAEMVKAKEQLFERIYELWTSQD